MTLTSRPVGCRFTGDAGRMDGSRLTERRVGGVRVAYSRGIEGIEGMGGATRVGPELEAGRRGD
jgi:hypothetical protein